MKKFLSLVLALVMVMSLVTINAGAADFADSDDVTYNEAVDVISAIGVVSGNAGNFNPNGGLTRQAAAKIICNLVLGPTTAGALRADTAPFPDVAMDNQFAGYITYCAQKGIIGGYPDGTFKPANPLSGNAFMKMLLGAIGYDSATEGFAGPNWSVAVTKLAVGIGLDDGLKSDFDGTKNVTREEAALYSLNTLEATLVEYNNSVIISNGSALGVDKGNAQPKTPINADEKKDYKSSGNDGRIQFCEEYFKDLKKNDLARDDFGNPSNTWRFKNDKIGTYAKTADQVYYKDVNTKDIYKDMGLSGSANAYQVFIDGQVVKSSTSGKLEVDPPSKSDSVSYYSVNLSRSTGDKLSKLALVASPTDDDADLVGNGSLVKVFEPDDVNGTGLAAVGTITVTNTYLLQVSGDYNEDDEELTLAQVDGIKDPKVIDNDWTVLSSDDFDDLDSFKEDDYVLVTVGDDGKIKSIDNADKVTAAVTEYVYEEGVTAGGKTYNYAYACKKDDENGQNKEYDLKEDYDLYLDPYGNVILADGVDATKNYVYVDEFGKSGGLETNGKALAYAYFTDGTDDEITLNKVNNKKVSADDFKVGKADNQKAGYYSTWYTYSKKDSGKYDLKAVEGEDHGKVTAKKGGTQITNYDDLNTAIVASFEDKSAYYGNSKTVYMIMDKDDDVKIYTGVKNVPDTSTGDSGDGYVAVAPVSKTSKYAKFVFIDVGSDGKISGSSSGELIYLLKMEKKGQNTDNDGYYRFKALVTEDGKTTTTTVRVDTALWDTIDPVKDGSDHIGAALFKDIERNNAGVITGLTKITTADNGDGDYYVDDDENLKTDGAVDFKNDTLILPDNDYYMASGYTIYVIKANGDVSSVKGGTAKTLDFGEHCRVVGVKDSKGDYSVVYIYGRE